MYIFSVSLFILILFLIRFLIRRRKKLNWFTQHEKFIQQAQNLKVDILFIGDSITEGWLRDDVVDLWNKNLKPLNAINFGLGGDRTHEILWRLKNGELENIKPRLVVLLVGINNIICSEKPQEISESIREIVAEIRATSPGSKILLHAIFPCGIKVNHKRELASQVNTLICNFNDNRNVFFIDLTKYFLDRNGMIEKEIMPDFLHLSRQGYLIWLNVLMDCIPQLL